MSETATLSTPPVQEQNRKRKCAFSADKKRLDTVEIVTEHGREEVTIPATMGTLYWAILKSMYHKANRPVYADEFCKGVAALMEDRDAPKWERYVAKNNVTIRMAGKAVVKTAKGWERRIVTNGRNLCRVGLQSGFPYGKRLIDQGHVMRYRTDAGGNGYFILFTTLTAENLAEQRRGRKSKVSCPALPVVCQNCPNRGQSCCHLGTAA